MLNERVVRVGPTLRQASIEDERSLSEKRRSIDLPFDHRPVKDSSLEDLDLDFFKKQYLPQAISPDVLSENHRTLEQQLRSLRFISQTGNPTYGAILAIGKEPLHFVPNAFVQFIRFEGESLTTPILNQIELNGPLFELLKNLESLLRINISTAIDITSSVLEVKMPDYPLAALQQLARNAIMHRAYESTNAPVKIHWFSDRVEIINPGGLYGSVNEKNLGHGITDYRNPLIAEVMKILGYVQRFGLGIPLAQQELEKNGNPPAEFTSKLGKGVFIAIVKKRIWKL